MIHIGVGKRVHYDKSTSLRKRISLATDAHRYTRMKKSSKSKPVKNKFI